MQGAEQARARHGSVDVCRAPRLQRPPTPSQPSAARERQAVVGLRREKRSRAEDRCSYKRRSAPRRLSLPGGKRGQPRRCCGRHTNRTRCRGGMRDAQKTGRASCGAAVEPANSRTRERRLEGIANVGAREDRVRRRDRDRALVHTPERWSWADRCHTAEGGRIWREGDWDSLPSRSSEKVWHSVAACLARRGGWPGLSCGDWPPQAIDWTCAGYNREAARDQLCPAFSTTRATGPRRPRTMTT